MITNLDTCYRLLDYLAENHPEDLMAGYNSICKCSKGKVTYPPCTLMLDETILELRNRGWEDLRLLFWNALVDGLEESIKMELYLLGILC